MTTSDRLLLDTDIVIHLLKNQPDKVASFLDLRKQAVEFLLSPIVVAEVGIRPTTTYRLDARRTRK